MNKTKAISYPRLNRPGLPLLLACLAFCLPRTSPAQNNSWTNQTGLWYAPGNWSLGVAPAASQSVYITNAGNKTVTIDATAAASYPATLTVNNLYVYPPTAAYSETLAVATGNPALPLTISNLLTIGSGASLNLTNSAVQVGGTATIDGSLTEASGFFGVGNNVMYVGYNNPGTIYLRGGTLAAYDLYLGFFTNANIYQYGGVFAATNEYLTTWPGQRSYYSQMGGTNRTTRLLMAEAANGTNNYDLFGGLLDVSGGPLTIGASGTATLNQYWGTSLQAAYTYCGQYAGSRGTYNISGGMVTNNSLYNGQNGIGEVNQTGGTNILSYYLGGVGDGGIGTYNLSGGTVTAYMFLVGAVNGSTGIVNQTWASADVNYIYAPNAAAAYGVYNLTNATLTTIMTAVGNPGSGVINQVGGYWWATNTLAIGGGVVGSSGQYNLLNGGILTAGYITVGSGGTLSVRDGQVDGRINISPGGVLTQNGGTIYSNIQNQGTVNLAGGYLRGRVVNYGSLNAQAPSVSIDGGLQNYGSVVLPPPGWALTCGGLDNEGSFELNGSTLNSSVGLVNNGSISGYGSVSANSQLTNNGQITISGGSLWLSSGGGVHNNGMITLASGYQLRANNTIENSGSVDLAGGVLAGYGGLNNNAGGMLIGPGTVQSGVNNNGGVYFNHGTLNLANFSNSGILMLDSDTANFVTAYFQNTGTIQGHGTLAADLNNSGTIEPLSGTLVLAKSFNNDTAGLITAGVGTKLLVSGLFSGNSGVINLRGGTIDSANQPINNSGQISGWGSLRVPFVNHGSVTLAGGSSTVYGRITNSLGQKITIANDPALFTGHVYNYGQFKVTSTTVQFAGGYDEYGVFSSDPATNIFSDLTIGPTGYLLGGTRDAFVVAGSLAAGSLQSNSWNTIRADLSLKGGSSHTFSLPGADAGAVLSGYGANFAWNSVRVGGGETLVLTDGNAIPGGALYTRKLILEGGLAQVGSIIGNGLNIYYDPSQPENNYLNRGTYDLAAGGKIIPVAEPIRILSVALTSTGNAVLNCVGVPDAAHSILGSTNLSNWSALGSATADLTGGFTYTDRAATNLPFRFYRISLP